MFTGIVECIGTVSALDKHDGGAHDGGSGGDEAAAAAAAGGGGGVVLTIADAGPILEDAKLGDSISVNGTCLTITDFTSSTFKVGVSPETLRRTNLGSLQPTSSTSTPTTATATTTTAPATRSRVNLERAVAATTRMGGHFVQGHVDTIATIERVEPDGEALTFRLRPRERDVLRHVVEKGYVTLDGASLTVTKVDDVRGWWEVMLVAYTQDKVVMAAKREGEHVNVEVDMLGKYVDKSVRAYFDALESPDAEAPKAESTGMMGVLEKLVQRAVDERMKANGGSGEAR